MKNKKLLTLILLAAVLASALIAAGCDFGAVYSVRVESGTFSGSTRTFQTLEKGFTASVSAQPSSTPEMKFKGWYSNGKLLSVSNPYVFKVTGNMIITAEYRNRLNYTVTASDGAYFVDGGVKTDTLENVLEDSAYNLCFKPSQGNQLDYWLMGNGLSERKLNADKGSYDETGVFVYPLSIVESGNYSPVSCDLYRINVESGAFTNGEFTGASEGAFRRGDKVNIQFNLIPKERYRFVGWKNSSGETFSDRSTALITVTGSDAISAEYIALYSVNIITVSADGTESAVERFYAPSANVQRLLGIDADIQRVEGADGATLTTDAYGNKNLEIFNVDRDWVIKVFMKT